jgi:carboxypeptidase family protein
VIHGVVTTSTGEPAKNIRLRATALGTGGSGGVLETRTSDEGEYRFQKLPLWGTYRIYADDEAAGYSPFSAGPSPGNPISEVEITSGHPDVEFDFSLPATGLIQIHLTNRRTGVLISQMTLWVTSFDAPESGLFGMSGRSDQVILVPPDRNLLLHVTEEGFREWDESVGRGKTINVPPQHRLTIEVQLDPLH